MYMYLWAEALEMHQPVETLKPCVAYKATHWLEMGLDLKVEILVVSFVS